MFEPLTDRSIQLADGRSMAFAEWGALDGPAVLYFPGTPHSRLWSPDVGATESTGVHLVTIDRPGYGRSDPAPAEMTMGEWTSDVVQLADALHLARCSRLRPCPVSENDKRGDGRPPERTKSASVRSSERRPASR